ncbi:MAG: ribonuclease HII [Desulfovibrionaceae bacterium]|nr:ribonuclease HII [Desulfovibrionaceae bacterium]
MASTKRQLLLYERPAAVLAGIDEVGRGALAGPVVSCAVILASPIPGLADSKTLSCDVRERLAAQIRKEALAYGIGLVGQRMIDKINILQATFMAMAIAVSRLRVTPGILAVDGRFTIPERYIRRFFCHRHGGMEPAQKAYIRGDASVPEIAAASIVAKTYRDALMRGFAERWPDYGFERHVGYGTAYHREALARLGPCPLHRLSFRSVVCE